MDFLAEHLKVKANNDIISHKNTQRILNVHVYCSMCCFFLHLRIHCEGIVEVYA